MRFLGKVPNIRPKLIWTFDVSVEGCMRHPTAKFCKEVKLMKDEASMCFNTLKSSISDSKLSNTEKVNVLISKMLLCSRFKIVKLFTCLNAKSSI